MGKHNAYQGKILRLDVSTGEKQTLPTMDYAEKYIGGRGMLSKLYWDQMDIKLDPFDKESPLMFMTGPFAGTPAISGSRWIIGGKSPFMHPNQYGISCIGGGFGAKIKSAGFDGIIITGKAKGPSYVYINNDSIEILDAKDLWGMNVPETLEKLSDQYGNASQSVCIGPAGENRIRFATIIGSLSSSASCGFGAVMGSKNLKAVVVTGSNKTAAARPDELKKINKEILALTSERDIVPPAIEGIDHVRNTHCPGCQVGCARGLYQHISGKEGYLKNCQSAYMYYTWDKLYHGGESSDNLFSATTLMNEQGLCTQEMCNIFRWLNQCHESGIRVGDMDISQLGSLEFLEELVIKTVNRRGEGDIIAEGTVRAAKALGNESEKFLDLITTKAGYSCNAYNPRYYPMCSIFYATESTNILNQLHEVIFPLMKWAMWLSTDGMMSAVSTDVIRNMAERFWHDKVAADFSSYEGKAKAAKRIQDRQYAKENLVVCDFLFPLTIAQGETDDVGDPSLESRILSAATGRDFSENDYYGTGSRAFHLQRAIHAVEGSRQGRRYDTINEHYFDVPLETEEGYFGIFNPDFMLPGPDGELITRRGKVVDRDAFKKMMDEYYAFRGFDVESGLQKTETLEKVGLEEIIPKLKEKKLVI